MGQTIEFLSQHHENLFDQMNADTIGRNVAAAYLLSGIISRDKDRKYEWGNFNELFEEYANQYPHVFHKQTLDNLLLLDEDEFILLMNFLLFSKKKIDYALLEEKVYIHTESKEKIFE